MLSMLRNLKVSSSVSVPHFDALIPTIHDSLNSVYAIDLYEDKFHFIFDDVTANGQKALFKDAPDRLRAHMVDHIKQVTGATARGTSTPTLRSEMAKFDTLFGKMEMSYLTNNGKYVNFLPGQDLATSNRMTWPYI